MNTVSLVRICVILISIIYGNAYAAVNLTSYMGFSVELSDDWFVIKPKEVSEANYIDKFSSLGIHEIAGENILERILKRSKNHMWEYYYDKNNLGNNQIVVKFSRGKKFTTVEGYRLSLEESCNSYFNDFSKAEGELYMPSCYLQFSNGLPFSHFETRQKVINLTSVENLIPIGEDIIFMVVGEYRTNDIEGGYKVLGAQRLLVDAITKYLTSSSK